MRITEDFSNQINGSSAFQQPTQPATSFQNTLADASSSLQWFQSYVKETPGQQMFTAWLGSQKISPAQFQAMSPQAQQKLRDEFEHQLREKMEPSESATSTRGL